jgi:hypothetical protein
MFSGAINNPKSLMLVVLMPDGAGVLLVCLACLLELPGDELSLVFAAFLDASLGAFGETQDIGGVK